MMGNSGKNEKGKGPASANSLFEANNDYANSSGLTFFEGNVEDDTFDSLLDMTSSFPEWDQFHRSVGQGIPETVSNPSGFQNVRMNMSSDAVNTNVQGVSLLPDWKLNWGQQCVNQGHSAVCAGGGDSSFVSFNRPQVSRDVTGSSLLFHPREFAPVHTRNNAGFNQSQSGIQGNFEGSFLSLGIGGNEESVSRSQLKESAANELKMARARKAMGQTLDSGFIGFESNNSGFSNQFRHENRMTSTNNEVGFHGTLNNWPGSSPQHIRSGDLDIFRDDKLKEAVSTELRMVHAQKAMGPSLNAGYMGFQSNTSGFSNQFGNVDRMSSTKNEVGVGSTINSGLGTSPHHILQMQQNDSRNIRSGDLDHYRELIGNQSVHSGTLGGNSAQLFSSQQHNLNKPPEFEKPSWLTSYHSPYEQLPHMRSTTANIQSYAGQVTSQNATPGQVIGSNMLSQRTAAPQVSWVDSRPAGIDAQFPKRLGVEFNVRNSLQTNQRHLSPMGTSLQTTSTGKGSTRLTDHVHRPSIGRTDGATLGYPINSQEPFFVHGRCENAPIQLAKPPQGAPSASASTVSGQSQKPDLHTRSHHKRSAVVPHPDSCWVQRQKIIHPTIHHSMPKPYIPITSAQIHPSIPVASQTQPGGPVAARIHPVVPRASNVRPRVPVTTAPVVSHITWKDPEATPKLSGNKCFLCKRDLALTSEGTVYQPAVPPAVAILPCGHSFHDQCLQNITPNDQAKDPPCIPCAIGEQ